MRAFQLIPATVQITNWHTSGTDAAAIYVTERKARQYYAPYAVPVGYFRQT